MNEKGMTPMDMRLLLTSLEAIKRVCTYEKGKLDSFEKSDKFSNKGKKGKKPPGTNSTVRVPKKARFEKHCELCKCPVTRIARKSSSCFIYGIAVTNW